MQHPRNAVELGELFGIDLFHAMEWIETQSIGGTVLTNRQNRQKRPSRRYLLPKCCQNAAKIQPGGPQG
jgi:hypothetical protein